MARADALAAGSGLTRPSAINDGRGGTLSRSAVGHFARCSVPRVDAIARTVVWFAHAGRLRGRAA